MQNDFADLIKHVVIIGGGLIGGSLAETIAQRYPKITLTLVDSDENTRILAHKSGLFKGAIARDVSVIDAQSHTLIVIACPLRFYASIVPAIAAHYADIADLHVTDVASVKSFVHEIFFEKAPTLLPYFIGAHPIAGTEKSGFVARRRDLFDKKNVMICSGANVSGRSARIIHDFWNGIAGEIIRTDEKKHDAVYARVSHLPQLLAFALSRRLRHAGLAEKYKMKARPYARLFDSPKELWSDIFHYNDNALREACNAFISFFHEKNIAAATKNIGAALPKNEDALHSAASMPCSLFEYLYWGALYVIAKNDIHFSGSGFRDCTTLPLSLGKNAAIDDGLPPANMLDDLLEDLTDWRQWLAAK